MGTSVQQLSDHVQLIASQSTWIEGLAIQQLQKTAELAGMQYAAGMPDLHPGKGYPIGAAFFTRGCVYPALIGNDIGCGMGLWQTAMPVKKVKLDKLEKRLKGVEGCLAPQDLADAVAKRQEQGIENSCFDSSLGTIGGGNHFAEFQEVVEVREPHALQALAIDPKQLQLLVHSGSRGLGQAVLTEHIQRFNHAGLAERCEQDEQNSPLQQYLQQHQQAVAWAELNRTLIAQRFCAALGVEAKAILDVNHNIVEAKTIAGKRGWLHRKGATPSDKGAVVIPGSRGDYSYLVMPEPSTLGLFSLAHGAGRKWRRGDCKGRLSHRFHSDELRQTALGSRVVCANKDLLYEEAPQAYKKAQSIIDDLYDAGLLRVLAVLKPVLTFKTQERGC